MRNELSLDAMRYGLRVIQKILASPSTVFLFCCLIFISGIFFASFLPERILGQELAWFAGLIGSLVTLSFCFKQAHFRLAALASLFLFSALWRYSLSLPESGPDKIWFYNNQKLTVTGVVAAEPEARDDKVKYLIDTKAIETLNPKSQRNVSGKLLVSSNLHPGYNYGDELKLVCRLKAPEKFEAFDYGRYLSRYDVYSLCYYPQITFVENTVASSGLAAKLYSRIFSFKAGLAGVINRGLVEPEASLARGMLLGDQKGLSEEVSQAFSRSGLSHIVAISGMNITMISSFLLLAFLALGMWRQRAFFLIIICLFAYSVLLGWPPSAVRAGVMSAVFMAAIFLGRTSGLAKSIVYTATLMLVANPRLLRDDIGFELSFLALLGMIYFYPPLDRWLDQFKLPRLGKLREYLVLTVAAQITTLPIMLLNFSQVSLIAPLANLLVLWLIPPLMVLLFFGLALATVLPQFAIVIFLPANLILSYLVAAARQTARLPGAVLSTEAGRLFVLVYFFALVVLAVKSSKPIKIKEESGILGC